MVEVVILDLDGTLIDTEPAIFSSFRYTFEKLLPKVDLTEEMIKSFIGLLYGILFQDLVKMRN